MCIIAISPTGIKPLDKTVLERCFRKNPDGAGFAVYLREEEMWHVKKGLMTFEDFWKVYSEMDFKDDDYVVCHFRVGTSGLKDGGNTHPFPLTNDVDRMRETEFKSPNIVIHNGVIGKGEAVPSDTMCFVRDYIYPLFRFQEQEPRLLEILKDNAKLASCRWFITDKKDIYMWGEWVVSGEKWEFSNRGFEPPVLQPRTVFTNPMLPAPKQETGKKHFSEYYNSAGFFDNAAWKRDIARNLGLPAETPNNAVLNNDDEIIVSNEDDDNDTDADDYIYGVLSDDGEVTVWDAAPATEKTGLGSSYLFCPECFEDRHLQVSPYEGQGDTLCQKCGAIFWDATGMVVSYDDEYRKIYLEIQARKEITNAKAAGNK